MVCLRYNSIQITVKSSRIVGKIKTFMSMLNIVRACMVFDSCMNGECKFKAYKVIIASAPLRSMKMKEAQ